MTPGSAASDGRPQRRDAVRNRDALVTVARAAFAGAHQSVSLESIAEAAGVGIGTLYRNFPSRESLVEAVYAAELDDVTASAESLLEGLPPEAALRAWVDRYAQFVATKRGMLDALRATWGSSRISRSATRERITAAIAVLLVAGAADGSLRADLDPDDVTALLLGVMLVAPPEGDETQTARLLDLVVDSVRAGSRSGSG